MNAYYTTRWRLLTLLVALGATIGWNHQVAAQQAPDDDQSGIEVLTRGPVHEAFAATITFDPEPGLVAPKAPPADIEELPPDQRPEGNNLTWIPGYWAWDDDRDDFLWVSGIWRALPPGRQWVPGYWGQSPQGAQWTSGYWADAAVEEIDYLPEPPATVEVGPNVAAPSDDQVWLPGCWKWQQNRYAWRPGYWATGHQNWDWVPDHYVWTPRGYVFVGGYYDYSVAHRGIVFAPVYFHRGLRTRSNFTYSPSIVINSGIFSRHLFVRPNYGHYYFGDYYGSNYQGRGFSPWITFHTSHRGYDPIYAHQRWQHRDDRGWKQRVEASLHNFRDNEAVRPPRTWAEHQERASRGQTDGRRRIAVAAPLDELSQQSDGRHRFQQLAPEERQRFGQRGQESRRYVQQRRQLEAAAARRAGEAPAVAAEPARGRLGRSPFVAPAVEQLGAKNAPPRGHEVLRPNVQAGQQPRTRGTQSGASQGFRQRAANSAQRQGLQGSQPRRAGPSRGQQRQAESQRNSPGAAAGQSQRQGATRGQPQGASQAPSQRQSQGASRGRAPSASQAPSQRQSRSASRGQSEGASRGRSRGASKSQGASQGSSGQADKD